MIDSAPLPQTPPPSTAVVPFNQGTSSPLEKTRAKRGQKPKSLGVSAGTYLARDILIPTLAPPLLNPTGDGARWTDIVQLDRALLPDVLDPTPIGQSLQPAPPEHPASPLRALLHDMSRCSLGFEEPLEIVVVGASIGSTALDQQKYGMIGSLLTDYPPRRDLFLRVITNAWGKAVVGLVIKDVTPGVFGFYFVTEEDRCWVGDHEPWCFDGQPLVLAETEPFDRDLPPLNRMQLWVHAHVIPPCVSTKTMREKIGAALGGVVDVPCDGAEQC